MKRYAVTANVTIGLNATVLARSKKHALELAADLGLPTIHEDARYNSEDESDDEWRTSGEIDGMALDIDAQVET